jgi:hypothetical protein
MRAKFPFDLIIIGGIFNGDRFRANPSIYNIAAHLLYDNLSDKGFVVYVSSSNDPPSFISRVSLLMVLPSFSSTY